MKEVFKKSHFGCKVTSICHGKGRIMKVSSVAQPSETVGVAFEDGGYETFDGCGYYLEDDYMPSLFFGWHEPRDWDYKEPEIVFRPLVLKEGGTVWCYVGHSIKEVLSKNNKRLVVASYDNCYFSMERGLRNTQTTEGCLFEYATKCSELD